MDNFIVSARKYRPATFNSVVGQSHITNTLKNAIKTGHLAQAFLFCGPRGVGKTTCARILAKTINCTNRTENIEACDICESCKSFNEGSSFNVFELDAASNNSVEDIRSLIDQVRYAPQTGAYKIYIIDEVHMLSTNAFNAFLKTLEEPPKHAIFILATTEKHKVIPTILSRCQIFDFNRIQIDDIANHLAYIAQSENVTAEPDALHIIAQKADGALRDACSIFDQIVSFAGNSVTYKAVIDNLNILDYDYYFKITDAVLAENISAALLLFNDILNNGFDGHNFIAGMSGHFRNLLVSKDAETIQLLEVGNNIREKYKVQAGKCSPPFLIKGLTLLNKADVSYKSVKNQRLLVELVLMQLCSMNSIRVDAEKKNDLAKDKPVTSQQTTVAAPVSVTPVAPPVQNPPAAVNTSIASIVSDTPTPTIANNVDGTTVARKIGIKTSTPSLNSFLNKEKKTENENETKVNEPLATYSHTPFTQDLLEITWNKYANGLKSKGKFHLSTTLLGRKPLLKQPATIEFTITNKTQEEIINEHKTDFLNFLRKELNNYAIQLELRMTSLEEKTNLYTATDRYKFLLEKNPQLEKLRQTFDLDLEF
jgi:DNA polymerase-3 subunit gamma/tau